MLSEGAEASGGGASTSRACAPYQAIPARPRVDVQRENKGIMTPHGHERETEHEQDPGAAAWTQTMSRFTELYNGLHLTCSRKAGANELMHLQ